MARRKGRTLTEVELEFMQVVWPRGEVSVEEVMGALADAGRDLSDGTVRKMLSILVDKGYLTRRRDGRGFLYRPVVGRDEANRSMIRDLLDRAFGDNAALMVAALFDARSVRRRELEKIKRLIADREKEGRR